MKQEMLFSGIGGQGIMLLGESLCNVAVSEGYQVTFAPFYGQEKRGGRTMCHVVVADSMESPIISEARLMLVMDEKSLQDFEEMVAPGGTLVINSSMIQLEPKRTDITVKKVPFYSLAQELGNTKATNMVALGYLLKFIDFAPMDKIKEEVCSSFVGKPKAQELNKKALDLGYQYKA